MFPRQSPTNQPQTVAGAHPEETEMKNRMFVTLLLSTVIALPGSAQQNNSTSAQSTASSGQTAPAAEAGTAAGKEPLRASHGDFWDGDEPGVACLVLHPFASKGYVRRHLQPIHDRVNELDEITASQAKTIKEREGRVQQGIQLASNKVNEADQRAVDARNRAEKAQKTAAKTNTRLTTVEGVVSDIDLYKATHQTEIRFRPGQNVLSEDAQEALDEIAAPLKGGRGYVIEVQGYSSGHGQAAIAASRKMADSVVRYLVLKHEIPVYRVYVVGMGNAPLAGGQGTVVKRTRGGRVEISVLKNDLDQLASTSGATTPPK
jgi:outer membrane protein OmpA-like peptidoglycan-associated protein